MVSVSGFEFKSVVLLRSRVLGVGSYGQVCEAQCDDLLCAAKIIHPTLLSPTPLQQVPCENIHRLPLNRFLRECALLKEIRHPNIVQYLGTCNDPDTQLPVLLIELLDQNLTTFLQNSLESVPYYIQVNLSLDIARGLAFLHANSLAHRDLSSNNILLVGSSRAKLSDLGMTKTYNSSDSNTNCPGTQVYMAPEAISNHLRYSSKSDVFSLGVILVQILTRKYPDPSDHFKTVKTIDPYFSSGKVEIRVPELERRENHIRLVFPGHPLLPIARQCLRNSEIERPSSSTLCQKITNLKSSVQYNESVVLNHSKGTASVSEVEKHAPLQVIDDLRVVDLIAAKDKEVHHLRQELEASRVSHEQVVQNYEQKILEKDQLLEAQDIKLAVKEEVLEQLRLLVEELDSKLSLSQATAASCSSEVGFRHSIDKHIAPCKMYRGTNSCAVNGNTAYFMPALQLPWSGRVYSLDLKTLKWSGLPDCPCEFVALVMIEDQLTAVGGQGRPSLKGLFKTSSPTNVLHTLSGGKWSRVYPPMPTPRTRAAAVHTNTFLIVIGGKMK